MESISAWYYHRKRYGSGVPPLYVVLNLYDKVIYYSCHLLDEYVEKRPEDIEAFVEEYIERLYPDDDGEESSFMAHFFKILLYVAKITDLDSMS